MDAVGKTVPLPLPPTANCYKEILYLLSELLGICEVIDSNGQEHVEERVWLFVVSGKDQMIDDTESICSIVAVLQINAQKCIKNV